ncbi:MAG: hypothetical protein HC896_03275 [Bacteroidales bacterium]|nr:hypothetical protein [Bacteroidales bacterium]
MSMDYEDDIMVGDLNTTRSAYKMLMLANAKPTRLFSFANTIGIGVKVKDSLGGEIREKNRFYKELTKEDYSKLKIGEEKAMKILKNTGAQKIIHSGYGATDLGGTIKIKKHLDEKLQTEYKNLYVCDGSVLPQEIRFSPTLTLICLSKYLAKHLLN